MKVVLFDGVCNLCNSFVRWIIKRDKSGQLKFSSLQSDYGRNIIELHNIHDQYLNTVIYLEDDQIYFRSEAVLRIIKQTHSIYSMAFAFRIIPGFIRDWIYNFIAKNRYFWFGKSDACQLPPEDMKERFIN